MKNRHEIRDPIYGFVVITDEERELINSRCFQRLRDVTQLATSSFVYPSATHKRFEHSLGVMHMASLIYDSVTDERLVLPQIAEQVSLEPDRVIYWRKIVRFAALLHDIGHTAFSHGPEDLMPPGMKHEHLTAELIRAPELASFWANLEPPVKVDQILKTAVGPKIAARYGLVLSDWEELVYDLIGHDVFGADRMDYLLRDAYHAGVAYGRFDHYRLIQTLRMLPAPQEGPAPPAPRPPKLGVEIGGIHAAEGLLLARYMMFSQVYLHHVRRMYDEHMKRFLLGWLPGGKLPTTVDEHLNFSDSDVIRGLRETAQLDPAQAGPEPERVARDSARRIWNRDHYRLVYRASRAERELLVPAKIVGEALGNHFGAENVHWDDYSKGAGSTLFPVYDAVAKDFTTSLNASEAIERLPNTCTHYAFVRPDLRVSALEFIAANRKKLLKKLKSSNSKSKQKEKP